MKTFLISWRENKKYNAVERSNFIMIDENKPFNVHPAQQALNIFMKNFGGLKKNSILGIQEYTNDKKEKIGELIVPEDDSAIVPYKLKR